MVGLGPVRAAAGLLVVLALVFGAGAFSLGFRAEGVPGPGLLPLLASLALLPLGLRLLLAPGRLGEASPFRARPLALLAALAAYALALPRAGFVVPTVVLLVLWARGFHGRPLGHALLLAVSLTAGAVLVFGVLLGVRLPLWPGGA